MTRMELERETGLKGFQIAKALRDLGARRQVEKRGVRWKALTTRASLEHTHPPRAPRPKDSDSGEQPWTPKQAKSRQVDAQQPEKPADWSAFRGLCRYYIECLELEGSGRAELSPEGAGTEFGEVPTSVDWIRLGRGEVVHIPMTAGVQAIVQEAGRSGARTRLRIGAPVARVRGRVREEDRLVPVFITSVTVLRRQGEIELRAELPPRVNEAWLESLFPKSRTDLREGILVSLGFYHEVDGDDGTALIPKQNANVQELWQALYRVQGRLFQEIGGPDRPQHDPPLQRVAREGLFHRAILFPMRDSTYTAGLMEELRKLAARPDEELRETALGPFFEPNWQAKRISHETDDEPALPEYQPLNPEQREVIRLSFEAPVVAVQGPPGTGKSTVVTHILTAHALQGESVLFASRNHRALEAVVPRLQAIDPERPLIVRLTKNLQDDNDQGDDWLKWILELLGRSSDPTALEALSRHRDQLAGALEERKRHEQRLLQHFELADKLGASESAIRQLEGTLGSGWVKVSNEIGRDIDREVVLRAERAMSAPNGGLLDRLRVWSAQRRVLKLIGRLRVHLDSDSRFLLDQAHNPQGLVEHLKGACLLATENADRRHLEQQVRAAAAWNQLVDELSTSDDLVRASSQKALVALARSLGAVLAPELQQRLVDIKGELGQQRTTDSIHRLRPGLRHAVERAFVEAVRIIPLWACSNLSVRSRIPFVPAAFDLVVIDEASQCDIPSCLPLLYRAKRAVIVGDPMQLRHIGRVGEEVENRLRELNHVDGVEFGRFRYSTNSIWDPAFAIAQGDRGQARMLKEHWRCHPAIAGYFSSLFYKGQLRVRTAEDHRPPLIRGERKLRGVEWTHVPGGSETIPGGSRLHRPQVEAIVHELERVATTGYDGTVGVVTPFRAHADRVRDAVHERLPRDVLKRWDFASDTADGFQGGERDLVLFGLVGGPRPEDTPSFYKRDHNRFNVAVSRARSLLHVFGDRNWAENSGDSVLVALVEAWRRCQDQEHRPARMDLVGPVWEPKLADGMLRSGIEYQQQYPACGYYLDFAIFERGIKLAVEVDGETYHRDASGNRRIQDLRRDQVLAAAGWRIVRFWVYQLREDLDGCVGHIRDIIQAGEASDTRGGT